MGAETHHYTHIRPYTPSRISNCGGMVAEEVVRQMEEELRQEAALRCTRFQPPEGRKLLVGMKLTTNSCREMLNWTIDKVAQPGDQILALHVPSPPLPSGLRPINPPPYVESRNPTMTIDRMTAKEHKAKLQEIANTLHSFLSVYESRCNLKQINLQVEIEGCGIKVKKALVEAATRHEACHLILGSNKHITLGRSTALGRYCLKRLTYRCTVVIIEHGEIILNKKGELIEEDMTRPRMFRGLRRSMKRVGRSKKVTNSEPDDPQRQSFSLQLTCSEKIFRDESMDHINYNSEPEYELDQRFGLGSPQLFVSPTSGDQNRSTSTQNFKERMQGLLSQDNIHKSISPDIQPRRMDMFLLHVQNDENPEASARERKSLERSPALLLDSTPSKDEGPEDALVPGWPLLHNNIGFDKKKPVAILHESANLDNHTHLDDRDLSVVNWALQLPHRRLEVSSSTKKWMIDKCDKQIDGSASSSSIVEEPAVSSSAYTGVNMNDHSLQTSNDLSNTGTLNTETSDGLSLSLAQKLDSLCLGRLCTAYAYEDLEAATSCFSQDNVVGRGGGSEVFKGEMRGGKLVAVKRLNHGPQAAEELLTDVEINTSLSHMHIVSLLGYCVDSLHLILVYEYLPEGNLEDHLHGKAAQVLPWTVRHKIALGAAKALDYLHHGCSRPVIHRDVKTSNILLTANFDSQLSDFGLAKWAPTNASYIRCNDVVGTFGYLAPEYFMYGKVNNKIDVYAFGVVLLELITGRIPIDTARPKGQENLVIWARPLLEEWNLGELVDPRLEGVYDVAQMNSMILAASLCVRQSAQRRPRINRVLHLLFGDHGENQSIRSRQYNEVMSMDLDELDSYLVESPKCGNQEAEFQTHLALAMLGVADDATSQCSVDPSSSFDTPHSSTYLEEYLQGRFSRSASFEE